MANEKGAGPQTISHAAPVSTPGFYLLAILVGLAAGGGAVLFRALIALFHNLLFLQKLSSAYDANIHTPASPLGPLIIAAPVAGAIVVALLVRNFAPEAKGHGVPEVMEAIYYHKGEIRPVVAVIKSLASAISIGSGGSVGREGPIVQIGSSFGATVGEILHLPAWQRITLIAGGAGGGIAATFNTPVGGVLFAMELMLHEVSARTLVPVTIATVTAAWIGRLIFGPHPSFIVPALETFSMHLTDPLALLAYAALGVITGLVSVLFIRSLYGFEWFFRAKVKGTYYRQHLLGMLAVGVLMYLVFLLSGHYYIQGVGYATIQDILSGPGLGIWFLLLLFALKLLVTSLTLGSGASGGVFSPALFMGATVGGACGAAIHAIAPGVGIGAPAFALAGMAGVVGGSTGAAVAAVVMIFEMTLDYSVIIPMTLTVAISYGLRRALWKWSIYTEKLALRNHFVPEALQANIHFMRPASELMDTSFKVVAAAGAARDLFKSRDGQEKVHWYLAADNDRVVSIVSEDRASAIAEESDATAAEIGRRDFCTFRESAQLADIVRAMHDANCTLGLVVREHGAADSREVAGIVTKARIADVLAESIEEFET
jgi:CIC family chloride channel protein